jgi:hypothetical protein
MAEAAIDAAARLALRLDVVRMAVGDPGNASALAYLAGRAKISGSIQAYTS